MQKTFPMAERADMLMRAWHVRPKSWNRCHSLTLVKQARGFSLPMKPCHQSPTEEALSSSATIRCWHIPNPKIRNTRITVENVNGEMKGQIRLVNCLILCLQFPTISKVIRMGCLLQNFKWAIIQNRDLNKPTQNVKHRPPKLLAAHQQSIEHAFLGRQRSDFNISKYNIHSKCMV